MLNSKEIKKDFPIFQHIPELVYLDSTATSLKPTSVIHKLTEYYNEYSANVHRGIYGITEKASAEYEGTRNIVSLFVHAFRPEEIIFTRGTTESINLVASTLGEEIVTSEHEIVVTIMDHHSNFVPWQQLALRKKATFKVVDITPDFTLDINSLDKYITSQTSIFALPYISNMLGTINPVKELIAKAKQINPNIITVVDAAQAAPHHGIDVSDLGCDFLAFSSHKMLGPTGVGVLWGRYELLEKMPPYQFGGDMIEKVYTDKSTFKSPPHKFEAGTPAIAEVIALKSAIQYLEYIGFESISTHEKRLRTFAMTELKKTFNTDINFFGPTHSDRAAGILTFTFADIHPHDIAQVLDEDGIAIRAGHHCVQPMHAKLMIPATARISLYIYNDEDDIEKLIQSMKKTKKLFKKS